MTFITETAKLLTAVMLASSLVGCSAAGAADTADNTNPVTSADTLVSAAGLTGKYAAEDSDAVWDAATATRVAYNGAAVTVTGDGASADGGVATISQAGTYVLSGTGNGQVIVNAPKDALVRLVFDGLTLTGTDSAPVYIAQADKAVIILAADTENTLTDPAAYVFAEGEDEPDAALFSKEDLAITGSGTLAVNANYHNGIASKDDLVITNGILTVTAVNDGIRGKDSISISGGTLTITAGGDGMQSNNATDTDRGWIALDGGTVTITAGNDGIQAETALAVNDGVYTLTTGGGSEAAPAHVQTGGFGGMGGGRGGMGGGRGGMAGQASTDTRPEMPAEGAQPAIPAEGAQPEIPADGTRPETPEGGTLPEIPTDGTRPEIPANGTPPEIPADDTTQTDTAATVSESYKGLKAGTSMAIAGGTLTIDAQDDALHTNGDAAISGGTLTLSTGDDGVHADGALTISGGTLLITGSYEGLEGATIDVTGGDIRLTASDDGMNAAGGSDGAQTQDSFAQRENYYIRIAGGFVLIDAGGDGLDANGNLYVDDGVVLVNGSMTGADSALDFDGECIVTGGTLLAAGSAAMAQTPSESSTQAVLSVTYQDVQAAGALASLLDGDKAVLSFAPGKTYQHLIISTPALHTDSTYTLQSGGTQSEAANGGYTAGGTVTGATSEADITLTGVVTRVADDGTAARR